jgi:hypothetical protein
VCGPAKACSEVSEACDTDDDCCDKNNQCIAGFCGMLAI